MARSFRLPLAPRPLPMYPAHVLYARPNPDSSRKQCANCILWQSAGEQCQIHDADVMAPADAVCGYHVFGQPDGALNRTNMDPVPPELSGLEQVPGGSSCDRCVFFDAQGTTQGICMALNDPDVPEAHPVVEALGCCCRFELSDG